MTPSSVFTNMFEHASLAGRSEWKNATVGIRVSFIDVGKGDCILIQSDESAVLIDTGYEQTAEEVVSYLRAQGVRKIGCIIITHYDRDHIGGIRAIGNAFPVGTVYLPDYVGADKNYRAFAKAVSDLGLPTQKVPELLSMKIGDALLTLYPSPVEYEPNASGGEGNDNDLSLAASLTGGGSSYLFAGDLEDDGMEAFLEGGYGRYDILKVPHHGEKSSCLDELLDEVCPRMAVITDSLDEPADKKTLRQLEKADVDTYRTSVCGTIVVTDNGAGGYSASCSRR